MSLQEYEEFNQQNRGNIDVQQEERFQGDVICEQKYGGIFLQCRGLSENPSYVKMTTMGNDLKEMLFTVTPINLLVVQKISSHFRS